MLHHTEQLHGLCRLLQVTVELLTQCSALKYVHGLVIGRVAYGCVGTEPVLDAACTVDDPS